MARRGDSKLDRERRRGREESVGGGGEEGRAWGGSRVEGIARSHHLVLGHPTMRIRLHVVGGTRRLVLGEAEA